MTMGVGRDWERYGGDVGRLRKIRGRVEVGSTNIWKIPYVSSFLFLKASLNILQFKVAPNFGTFASLFDPPLAAYFYTPHMSMYSSGF